MVHFLCIRGPEKQAVRDMTVESCKGNIDIWTVPGDNRLIGWDGDLRTNDFRT